MSGKSKIRFLLTVLAGAVLAGCADNDSVTFKVVATTDVHGRIFDTDCLTGVAREGSLAKVSTFLKGVRKENRDVIYLDAGDILQGSVDVYQDVTAQFQRPSLAAEAYNLLDCYAICMGNHDFAIGPRSYDRFFRTTKAPVMGANVYFEKYGDYLFPYRIRDVKGLNVAVLGLTTPIVNYSIPSDRMELDVADAVDAAKHYMPILRNQMRVDVVIGLVHSGLDDGRMDDEGLYENVVSRLLSEVPGFDMIIYGHDHKERCFKAVDCKGDSVLLMNPGPFAKKAAVATVNVTRSTKAVRTKGELADITGLEPDKRFLKKLSGWYDDVKHYSDSVIGRTSVPMEAGGVLWRSSTMMNYVHSFQMDALGAEVSLSSPVFTQTYIPAGDITIRDAFSMYFFDNTMVSVMLKGSEIRDVLEYSASLFYNTVTDGSGGLLRREKIKRLITAAGVDYEIDVTKPVGSRVRIIRMSDGKAFNPDKLYRTTINSFLYGSGESPLFGVLNMSREDMKARFNGSSRADIRYFILTDLALRHEVGAEVSVKNRANWKLVPEDVVSGCLAKDTVNYNIIQTRTSLKWD